MHALIAAHMEPLTREMQRVTDELNRYKQNGLAALLTRNLAYHNVPYSTAVPTRRDRQGTPELVDTGGVRYIYFNVDGETGWEGVALS